MLKGSGHPRGAWLFSNPGGAISADPSEIGRRTLSGWCRARSPWTGWQVLAVRWRPENGLPEFMSSLRNPTGEASKEAGALERLDWLSSRCFSHDRYAEYGLRLSSDHCDLGTESDCPFPATNFQRKSR